MLLRNAAAHIQISVNNSGNLYSHFYSHQWIHFSIWILIHRGSITFLPVPQSMQRHQSHSHTILRGSHSPMNSACGCGLRKRAFVRSYNHDRPERVGATVCDDRYTWITYLRGPPSAANASNGGPLWFYRLLYFWFGAAAHVSSETRSEQPSHYGDPAKGFARF